MSNQLRNISIAELQAAQDVLRGQLADPVAIGMLMDLTLGDAERLLRPGEHTSALGLAVFVSLVRRLRGMTTEDSRTEAEDAMLVYRLVEHRGTSRPADDLALAELSACQAELRGVRSDVAVLAEFLGTDAGAARRLRDGFEESRAGCPVMLACLVTRLHGRIASEAELLAAVHAVLERRSQLVPTDFRRPAVH